MDDLQLVEQMLWICVLYIYMYTNIISVMFTCDSGDFIVISDGGDGVQR